MDKEKIITIIEMLECEIEEISDIPKVFSKIMSASYLLDKLKDAVYNETQIDLDEIFTMIDCIKHIKSEKNLIKVIQNMDVKTLDKIADFRAKQNVLQSKENDEEICEEDFKQLKEFHLFLLKNGLFGKPIKIVEYNGYSAEQFQNFKVLFTKENGEMVICNYYKKATKQELEKLIDDIKSRKIR